MEKPGAWQPIETAPKDATEILGYWNRSKVMAVVYWWHNAWLQDRWEMSPPTHWQPLPEPPPT
jgi:hypothetical protein